jgi:hypothetical protein
MGADQEKVKHFMARDHTNTNWFNSRSSWLTTLIGLALLSIDGFWAWHTWQFVQSAVIVPGTVIALKPHKPEPGGEGSTTFAPVVRFQTRSGQTEEFTSGISSSPPDYSVGEQVTVIHPPDNPYDAQINVVWLRWLGPVILLVVGLGVAGTGLGSKPVTSGIALVERAHQRLRAPHRLTFTEPDTKTWLSEGIHWAGILQMLLGIGGLAWLVSSVTGGGVAAGNLWGSVQTVMFSSVIFLGGCCCAFRVSHRVEIDLRKRRWKEQHTGIFPFARRTEGSLDVWEHVRYGCLHRVDHDEGGETRRDVWVVGLDAGARPRPPLPLPGLEFRCESVSRADALALAQELARKLNLSLREV